MQHLKRWLIDSLLGGAIVGAVFYAMYVALIDSGMMSAWSSDQVLFALGSALGMYVVVVFALFLGWLMRDDNPLFRR